MNIYQTAAFARAFKDNLTEEERDALRELLKTFPDIIGRPHLHRGAGVRPFGRYHECRVGLKKRALFLIVKGDVHLIFAGNHNQVRNYVRNNG